MTDEPAPRLRHASRPTAPTRAPQRRARPRITLLTVAADAAFAEELARAVRNMYDSADVRPIVPIVPIDHPDHPDALDGHHTAHDPAPDSDHAPVREILVAVLSPEALASPRFLASLRQAASPSAVAAPTIIAAVVRDCTLPREFASSCTISFAQPWRHDLATTQVINAIRAALDETPTAPPASPPAAPDIPASPASALSASVSAPASASPSTPFVPRVFISHTSADNDFGAWLVARLRSAGIDVWYDSLGMLDDSTYTGPVTFIGGIAPADSWQQQIVEALTTRNVFLLILSEKAVASRWVQNEIELAWSDKNSADITRGKVIVPVLRETCDIPRLVALVQYVNFLPSVNQEYALKQVLEAVRRGSTVPMPTVTVGPPFDLATLPPLERFIGREPDVEHVLTLLTKSTATTSDPGQIAAVAATNGMGGIGKTALATEVVRRLMARQAFPDGIAVLICKDRRDPIEVLKLVLARFTDGRREPDESTLPALADRARSLFKGRQALVVLDNVEKDWPIGEVVQTLRAAGAAVLVASRAPIPTIAREATVKLDVLPLPEALDLFALYYGRGAALDLTREEHAAVTTIVETLGRHTLATKLAAANAAALNRPLATVAHELREHPARALLLQDGDEAVRYVLASSVAALSPAARAFFALFAAFATADVGRQAALNVVRALANLAESDAQAEEALKELVALRLVDPALSETMPADQGDEEGDRERLRLHPLVQAYSAEQFAAWDESNQFAAHWDVAAWYAAYAPATPDAAISVLAADDDNITAALTWLQQHAADVDNSDDSAASQDDSQKADAIIAAICRGMAEFWYLTSRNRQGLTCLPWGIAAASRIATRTGAPTDRQRVATLLQIYGDILLNTGSVAAAQNAFVQALAHYRASENRLGEANTLRALGDVAQQRGDLTAAKPLYQQALAHYRASENRLGEAAALARLGDVAQWRGDLATAESLYQQALVHYRAIEDRQGEANTLQSLGEVAQQRGDLATAEPLYQQALVRYQAIEDRQGEANTLQSLGDVALLRGDLASAEPLYQQALVHFRASEDRLGEANTLRALGEVAQLRGDLAAAESLYQQALGHYRAIEDRLGETAALARLGEVAQLRGDLAAAESLYQQALVHFRAIENRRGEGNTLTSLGDLAQVRGQFEAAESLFQQALAIDRAIQDRDGERIDLTRLGDLALLQNHPDEAQAYFTEALAIATSLDNRTARIDLLLQLGDLHSQRQQFDGALARYDQILALDPQNIDAWANKGDTLDALDLHEQALAAYESALQLDPNQSQCWNGKAYALAAMQRYDEALASIDQAITLAPDDADFYDSKGEILMLADRYEQALTQFEQAVSLDATFVNSWRNLVTVYRHLGREADAVEAERKVEQLESASH